MTLSVISFVSFSRQKQETRNAGRVTSYAMSVFVIIDYSISGNF